MRTGGRCLWSARRSHSYSKTETLPPSVWLRAVAESTMFSTQEHTVPRHPVAQTPFCPVHRHLFWMDPSCDRDIHHRFASAICRCPLNYLPPPRGCCCGCGCGTCAAGHPRPYHDADRITSGHANVGLTVIRMALGRFNRLQLNPAGYPRGRTRRSASARARGLIWNRHRNTARDVRTTVQ